MESLREASLRISLTSEQSAADDQPLPMLHGIPQDSVLWLPSDSMTINGQEATLRLGVPRTTWVYCVTSSRNKILTHQWHLLTPGMHAFTFTLPDQTDEYLDVRFLTCREDGTFYERHHHLKGINRTELHIVPVTMRDYLTPDAHETWTFRLTDAQGKPLQGHMVLNMTDQGFGVAPFLVMGKTLYAEMGTPVYHIPQADLCPSVTAFPLASS